MGEVTAQQNNGSLQHFEPQTHLKNGSLLRQVATVGYSELPVMEGDALLSLRADMAEIERQLAPAPPKHRFDLLKRLSASLPERDMDTGQAEVRLLDCTEALEDLPASLMNLARIRVMKGRRWFPLPFDIYEAVQPEIDALQAAKFQLTRLIHRAGEGV